MRTGTRKKRQAAEDKVSKITICKLPYQDLPFVHGVRNGRDVWLRNDGVWTEVETNENVAIQTASNIDITVRAAPQPGTGKASPNETFVLLKPDGVKKQLLVDLLVRLRVNGLRVIAIRELRLNDDDVERLYGHCSERKSYKPMKRWLMSGRSIALYVQGRNAVNRVRKFMGTGLWPYPCRSFRGEHATTQWRNGMHASDSPETAKRELGWFFPDTMSS